MVEILRVRPGTFNWQIPSMKLQKGNMASGLAASKAIQRVREKNQGTQKEVTAVLCCAPPASKFFIAVLSLPPAALKSITMATDAPSSRQLSQKEADIQLMLAADVHLGTKNCDFQMERYIFKRRQDGNIQIPTTF
ncbi:40S ribosomal protein sa-like [Trifolium pratense]|uniref:40S ribosomal protein sa-like n=1 Tax=Trifolium pratense TaxID=57577 RepID=A0A2K3LHG0_TRIPR|nr:40S ribosomal protein sa-like [Trifolium pratense]